MIDVGAASSTDSPKSHDLPMTGSKGIDANKGIFNSLAISAAPPVDLGKIVEKF